MLEVVAEEKTKEGVQKKVGKNNPRTSDKDYLVQSHRPPEHYVRMLTGNKVNSKVQLLTKLQQTYGNRYVQRVMAKLKIGQPNDKYEQEADRIAQQVVSSQSAFCEKKAEEKLQGRMEEEEKKKKEEEIMTKRTSEGKITDDFEKSLYRSRGMGKSLPADIRTFMEERFGVDFGDVRIHTDTNAALMAEALNAEAFTYGRDIYFGAGKYKPETTEGKRLLAHELTHVVQQRGISSSSIEKLSIGQLEDVKLASKHISSFIIQRANGKSGKGFFHYFKECMSTLGLPTPESLFTSVTTAITTIRTIQAAIDMFGKSVTIGELIGAGVLSEKLLAAAAVTASFYLGSCIGCLATAAGQSLSGGESLGDVLYEILGPGSGLWIADLLGI